MATTAASVNVTTALFSTTSSNGAPEPWVVGVIVGAIVLALVLVGLVVFCLLKGRRAEQPAAVNNAAELKQPPQSEYGKLAPAPPLYGDVTDVRDANANANGYDIVKLNPQAEYDAPDSTLKF
jgi:hypothetical protein